MSSLYLWFGAYFWQIDAIADQQCTGVPMKFSLFLLFINLLVWSWTIILFPLIAKMLSMNICLCKLSYTGIIIKLRNSWIWPIAVLALKKALSGLSWFCTINNGCDWHPTNKVYLTVNYVHAFFNRLSEFQRYYYRVVKTSCLDSYVRLQDRKHRRICNNTLLHNLLTWSLGCGMQLEAEYRAMPLSKEQASDVWRVATPSDRGGNTELNPEPDNDNHIIWGQSRRSKGHFSLKGFYFFSLFSFFLIKLVNDSFLALDWVDKITRAERKIIAGTRVRSLKPCLWRCLFN